MKTPRVGLAAAAALLLAGCSSRSESALSSPAGSAIPEGTPTPPAAPTGGRAVIPPAPCETDADCRLSWNASCGCRCLALGAEPGEPACARSGAAGCGGDPCIGARAVCDPVRHLCIAQRLPAGAQRGPCASDADCRLRIDCDCSCDPVLASSPIPEGEAWLRMCNGGPPPNCGAQSPCADYGSRCDPDTSACVLVAASR
ncbi:MAG: hypothetical protein KF729_30900 [Sandaracinaceae bacterium]|nr:hypothetical protein [Sandaracinaceae bacterium]